MANKLDSSVNQTAMQWPQAQIDILQTFEAVNADLHAVVGMLERGVNGALQLQKTQSASHGEE